MSGDGESNLGKSMKLFRAVVLIVAPVVLLAKAAYAPVAFIRRLVKK